MAARPADRARSRCRFRLAASRRYRAPLVEGVAMSAAAPCALNAAIGRVRPVDVAWRVRAESRLDQLTKPVGSLGRLESIAARLCAIQGTLTPRTTPRRIVVFAADHGVT